MLRPFCPHKNRAGRTSPCSSRLQSCSMRRCYLFGRKLDSNQQLAFRRSTLSYSGMSLLLIPYNYICLGKMILLLIFIQPPPRLPCI